MSEHDLDLLAGAAHHREELPGLIGMPGRRPDVVMRFGRGEALPYSAHRPVDAILI